MSQALRAKKLKTLGGPPKHPCEVETELDKISSLPEHLIDNILSRLSIRDVVRTSILARRWRYKWTTVPSLVFDELCFRMSSQDPADLIKKKLVSIIKDVLVLHNGPILKFKLSHKHLEGFVDIDKWIVRISRSCIKEFMLEIWKGERYKIPSCLFSCESLTDLELYNCTLAPPLTFKGFKNLERLDLTGITISKDVLENLIRSCRLLQSLCLNDCDGFTDLNIDAPNLEFLVLRGVFHDVSFENTFSLTSICISRDQSIKHMHDEPKADKTSSRLLRFFANLPHIQELVVQAYFWEYLACGNIPRILPNKCLDLTSLSIIMDFNDKDETEAALSLLRSSPNLQKLEFLADPTENQLDEGTYTNLWGDDLWSALFAHLRVATIHCFSGYRSELDFIKFVLTNAPVLESMTVRPVSKDGSAELLKKLLRFGRASMHLEIIYADEDL